MTTINNVKEIILSEFSGKVKDTSLQEFAKSRLNKLKTLSTEFEVLDGIFTGQYIIIDYAKKINDLLSIREKLLSENPTKKISTNKTATIERTNKQTTDEKNNGVVKNLTYPTGYTGESDEAYKSSDQLNDRETMNTIDVDDKEKNEDNGTVSEFDILEKIKIENSIKDKTILLASEMIDSFIFTDILGVL